MEKVEQGKQDTAIYAIVVSFINLFIFGYWFDIDEKWDDSIVCPLPYFFRCFDVMEMLPMTSQAKSDALPVTLGFTEIKVDKV